MDNDFARKLDAAIQKIKVDEQIKNQQQRQLLRDLLDEILGLRDLELDDDGIYRRNDLSFKVEHIHIGNFRQDGRPFLDMIYEDSLVGKVGNGSQWQKITSWEDLGQLVLMNDE
jgi:hypothetical protein